MLPFRIDDRGGNAERTGRVIVFRDSHFGFVHQLEFGSQGFVYQGLGFCPSRCTASGANASTPALDLQKPEGDGAYISDERIVV
jgi:hypothetical protein